MWVHERANACSTKSRLLSFSWVWGQDCMDRKCTNVSKMYPTPWTQLLEQALSNGSGSDATRSAASDDGNDFFYFTRLSFQMTTARNFELSMLKKHPEVNKLLTSATTHACRRVILSIACSVLDHLFWQRCRPERNTGEGLNIAPPLSSPPIPFPPLEVRPLNPARVSGGALYALPVGSGQSPSRNRI